MPGAADPLYLQAVARAKDYLDKADRTKILEALGYFMNHTADLSTFEIMAAMVIAKEYMFQQLQERKLSRQELDYTFEAVDDLMKDCARQRVLEAKLYAMRIEGNG